MSIYTNSSTNLEHGIETRDLLFTLSNGMNYNTGLVYTLYITQRR
jgi:hypothetical protein